MDIPRVARLPLACPPGILRSRRPGPPSPKTNMRDTPTPARLQTSVCRWCRCAAGAALAIALIAASGCRKPSAQGPQRPPPAVTATPAVARDVPLYIDEIGRCTAVEMVSIQPQISGRITELLFKDGDEIHKDQPLFTIDPRPYEAQLHQAEANLGQSKANHEFAKYDLVPVEGVH